MGLIRQVTKAVVTAGLRTILDRIDPANAATPPVPAPADAPSPAPAPVAVLAAPDETPEPPLSKDDIDRQFEIAARTPASELKLWAEDQQRIRAENRLDAPEFDPDFDDVQGGTPKGMEILRAHGYRSNPWAA